MRIEDDNGLSALIASAHETKLCGGFAFTEGPVWVPNDACLLFSDIPNDRIHRWREGMTDAEIYREPSHQSNGLTLDQYGSLIACEHRARRVTRAAYGGDPTAIAEHYHGKRFNSPNDVVAAESGALYFTDPTYGLDDPAAERDLPYQGVYRLGPRGALRCLDTTFVQPNGLAFSPDETVLYVGDSHENHVRRFDLDNDGSLRGGEVFVAMGDDPRPSGADGMKVDEDGRLWTTGAGGVWVVDPDGTRLGVLALPEYPANLAFGGPDFSSLFLTAQTSVYRVETRVRGIAPGSRGVRLSEKSIQTGIARTTGSARDGS